MSILDDLQQSKKLIEQKIEDERQKKIQEEQRKANQGYIKQKEEEQRYTDGIVWQQVKEIEDTIQNILGSESESVAIATLAYLLRENFNLSSFYDTLRKVKRTNDRLNKKS